MAALDEARLAVVEDWLQARLSCGEHADVISELRRLSAEHPLREPFWALLMVALHRAGRQADALAAYGQARTHLADEPGLDPGPQLRQPHQQLLTGDPALTPSPIFAVSRRISDLTQYDPAPGRWRLGELLDRVRAVGVPVDLEASSADGTPPPQIWDCGGADQQ